MNEDFKYKELQERMDFIEFRQQLLFDNDSLSRLLFEYKITEIQYKEIMNLMEKYRNDIAHSKEVNHGAFEDSIFKIVPQHNGDYHMCEYLTRAFMDEGRWDEVFPALYGNMPKYQYLMEDKDE